MNNYPTPKEESEFVHDLVGDNYEPMSIYRVNVVFNGLYYTAVVVAADQINAMRLMLDEVKTRRHITDFNDDDDVTINATVFDMSQPAILEFDRG